MAIKEPEDKETPLLELEAWREIIKSESWRYFKNLLNVHKEHLERQVIVCVASRTYDEASRYEARANECKKILQLAENRLGELKKTKEV